MFLFFDLPPAHFPTATLNNSHGQRLESLSSRSLQHADELSQEPTNST